jgi:hypothetical protein
LLLNIPVIIFQIKSLPQDERNDIHTGLKLKNISDNIETQSIQNLASLTNISLLFTKPLHLEPNKENTRVFSHQINELVNYRGKELDYFKLFILRQRLNNYPDKFKSYKNWQMVESLQKGALTNKVLLWQNLKSHYRAAYCHAELVLNLHKPHKPYGIKLESMKNDYGEQLIIWLGQPTVDKMLGLTAQHLNQAKQSPN